MSKKLLISAVVSLSLYLADAQSNYVAVPLKPKNVPGYTFGTMVDANRGFLCGNTWFFGTYNAGKFQLHSFTGSIYKKYPAFFVDSLKLNRVVQFRDTILLLGKFYNPLGIQRNLDRLILRGNSWDSFGVLNNQINSSAEVDNKLFVLRGGASLELFEFSHWGSAKFAAPIFCGGGQAPNLMARNKGSEMIVMGACDSFIYRLKNNDWDTLSNSSPDNGWLNVLQGDTCIYMYNPFTRQVHKLGMDFKLKLLTTITNISLADGQKGLALVGDKLLIGSVKTYDIKTNAVDTSRGLEFLEGIHYASGMAYGIDVSTSGNTTRVYEITAGTHVFGRMFFDKTGNCIMDPGEPVFKNIPGYAINAGDTVHFFCDDTGAFSTVVPPGISSFRLAEPYITASGSFCGIQTDTFLTAGKTVRYDMPFLMQANQQDVGIKLVGQTGFRARQGFKEMYSLICKNYGTVNENLEVLLKFPDTLNFISSDVTPIYYGNRELRFAFSGVGAKSEQKIKLVFEVPPHRKIGSSMIFDCKLDTFTDLDSNNNKYRLIQKVVSAYDPNSKESVPQGVVYNPVSLIKYQINFQNLGTDTAYRILVVDSFVPNFPLDRLQMTGSSHPYSLSVRPGNVLIWEFDNILLPPTRENVEKSCGFITFEAPLRSPTKKGQVISNRAHIYFDYQKAVTTNWDDVIHSQWGMGVRNIHKNGDGIKVFPNPTSGGIHILSQAAIGNGYVFDAAGAKVKDFKAEGMECDIDLNDLAPGIYFLRIPAQHQTVQIIKN